MSSLPSRRTALGVGVVSAVVALGGCSGSGEGGASRSTTTRRGAADSARVRVTVDGTAPNARRSAYRKALLAAVAPVEKVWGRGAVPARVRVTVPASSDEFDDLTASARSGGASVPATTRADGRVVIHPDLWERTTAAGRQVVLTHELTHVTLGQGGWSQVPRWVVEGSAELTAYRGSELAPSRIAPGVSRRLRAGEKLTGPPTDTEVAGADGYGLAWAWCRYLVARNGTARFTTFVRAAGRGGSAAATTREFEAAYGTAPHRLASSYSTWLASWE